MKKRKLFLACPIGSEGSPERQRSDGLLKYIIQPVVESLSETDVETEVLRADKLGEPGRITNQVIRELCSADVVIADLTTTNPNVMYEIGIRQAIMRPYVLMAERGQALPFDLSDFRTVFYLLQLDAIEQSQAELKTHLEKALDGQVSVIDQTIFSQIHEDNAANKPPLPDPTLLVVLEACNQILREARETKSLSMKVGEIALDLRDIHRSEQEAKRQSEQQQMGMWLFTKFLENPEAVEKIMPAVETLARFGTAQQTGRLPGGQFPPDLTPKPPES